MSQSRVILIDNKDSFVFNLAESFGRLQSSVTVLRNTVDPGWVIARALAERALIVLSPGPGHPRDAGSTVPILTLARGQVPVFGVCLGHQAMLLEAGGVIESATSIVHGKASLIAHDGRGPFRGIRTPMAVGRYHSLCGKTIPPRYHVHAWHDGMAMAISDAAGMQVGVQFHPESILTPEGDKLLATIVQDARMAFEGDDAVARPTLTSSHVGAQ